MFGAIKKIVITIMTQGIVLILSIVSGFILPEKMGPENFGYWQIYLFYLTYVNFLGLGFNDGIALFYAGYDYDELPFEKLRSSMRIAYLYLMTITFLGILLINCLVPNELYRNIYYFIIINIPLTCIQCIVFNVVLAIGKTEVYNVLNVVLKVLCVGLYVVMLVFEHTDPMSMIYVDTFARVLITIICIWIGKDFLFGKINSIREGWDELKEKCRAGFMITIAIVSSMLMPMVGRYVVEIFESIATYGIFSFSMSLLSIILAFTNVLGTVIFPLLKRMKSDLVEESYFDLSFVSDTFVILALYMYLPLMYIIQNIMPQYIPALSYLAILLSMCIPLGRMQLLVTPYYKINRMEKEFLYANLIGVGTMGISLLLIYKICESIVAISVCTTLVMVLWVMSAEVFLHKKDYKNKIYKQTLLEILVMIMFCWSASFNSYIIFFIVYSITVCGYFAFRKNDVQRITKLIINS